MEISVYIEEWPKNKNFRSDFLKFQSLVYDMGSKGGNDFLEGFGGGDYKEVSSSETITWF